MPTGAERAAWDTFEMELNTRRKKGQVPIRLDRPWHGDKRSPQPEMVPVDAPERLAALERLKSDS